MVAHVTYAAFDDLQLAHERGMQVKIEWFRNEFNNRVEDDETARVMILAQDGNDYAIVETDYGQEYTLIVLSNNSDDGFGQVIKWEKFASYGQALAALGETSILDYDVA